jgi:glycosyltransferase involved in cell wall biosynthesis
MHDPRPVRTLYLCYFGLREPLVQTQVLPYLRELVAGGIDVSLLTFEPERRRRWSRSETAEWHDRLASDGIRWHARDYHRRPSLPATLFDIAAGAVLTARLAHRQRFNVLHARGHVPMAMAVLARLLTRSRLIFDIRGFMPEEYTDSGHWRPNGTNYRLAKLAESRFMSAADGFVVLTDRARQILFPGCSDTDVRGRPIEVIPCCVDLRRFEAAQAADRDVLRSELGLNGRRVIVYLGALGSWYLTDELAAFLGAAHRQDPTTYSMILTQSPPAQIAGRLSELGVGEDRRTIRCVSPDDVPRYLRAADLAVSFIKRCYSKQASSPTKLAEYLASGLPVICNAGIGDVDELLATDRTGIVIPELTAAAFETALIQADALRRDPDVWARCRASARERFDLSTTGAHRYRCIYRRTLLQARRPLAARETAH